jgi:hypothetical protein
MTFIMFGALQFQVRLENLDTCIDLLTFGLRVAAIDFGCAPYFFGQRLQLFDRVPAAIPAWWWMVKSP